MKRTQPRAVQGGRANPPPRVFFPSMPPSQRLTKALPTKATHPNPRLPQELVDLVLDQLRDNKPALSRCSLVSRAWAKSTARHLFGDIRWPKCHHWWSDDGSQYAICRCGESDLGTLHDALSGSARMCEAVVDLRVSFKKVAVEDEQRIVAVMTFYVERLFMVLDALPKLRRLELRSFLDTHTTTKGAELFQRRGRTLDALTFRRTIVDSECATEMVTYFENISELTFVQPRSGGAIWKSSKNAYQVRPKTTVSSLKLLDCSASDTLTCLRTLYPVVPSTTLMSLAVGQLCSLSDTQVVEDFVRKASRLQTFHFSVVFWLPTYKEAFKSATARQRLVAGSESDWSSVVPLLDELSLTHTSLRDVCINFKFNSKPDLSEDMARATALRRLRNLDWSPVDDAVAALLHLEKLRLSFSFAMKVDELQWRTDVMAMLKSVLQSRTRSCIDVSMAETI